MQTGVDNVNHSIHCEVNFGVLCWLFSSNKVMFCVKIEYCTSSDTSSSEGSCSGSMQTHAYFTEE